MKTWDSVMKSGGMDSYDNYCGDDSFRYWYMVGGKHRDSDILELSNFDAILENLGGESDTVRVIRFNHWAVGWIEEIMIDPNDKKTVGIAESIEIRLANYPILNEDDFTNREHGEEMETWEDSYRDDFRDGMEARFNMPEDSVIDSDMDMLFKTVSENANEYWQHGGGCYIDIDRIVSFMELSDIAEYHEPAADMLEKESLWIDACNN